MAKYCLNNNRQWKAFVLDYKEKCLTQKLPEFKIKREKPYMSENNLFTRAVLGKGVYVIHDFEKNETIINCASSQGSSGPYCSYDDFVKSCNIFVDMLKDVNI